VSPIDDEEPAEVDREKFWQQELADPEAPPQITRVRRPIVLAILAAIGLTLVASIAYAVTHRVRVAKAEKELKPLPYGDAEAKVPQSIANLEMATTPAHDDTALAATLPQVKPEEEDPTWAEDRAQAGLTEVPRNYHPELHHYDDTPAANVAAKEEDELPPILLAWPEHKQRATSAREAVVAPAAPSLQDSLAGLQGLQAQAANIGSATKAIEALAGGQDDDARKEQFQHSAGIDTLDDGTEDMAECELEAGTPIAGNILVATNSDLPSGNTVTIQVSKNVYCGGDHQHLALPQGSKFVGAVDQRVVYGQDRLQLCMKQLNRPASLMHPNGERKQLGCMVVADIEGAAGMVADVDNHWGAVIAGSLLSAVLSVGASSSMGNQQGFAPTVAENAAHGAGAAVNQAGTRIVNRELQRKPTLTTRQLEGVTVMFTSNVPLEPWLPRKRR
jgi:type IV secretory pathway VirB10-like protein